MHALSPVTVGALALAVALYFLYKSDLWGPLVNVPGPFLSRVTRLWEAYTVRSGNWVYKLQNLHKKHGTVVRLAPGRYSFSGPEAVKQIYGHGGKYLKADTYDPFMQEDQSVSNIFAERDPGIHAKDRRQIASLYSLSTLKSYEPFVEDTTCRLVSRFEEKARSSEKISLQDWMQFYAFDVIGEISFAKSFGYIEAGSDNLGALDEAKTIEQYGGRIGLTPEYHTVFSVLARIFGLRNPAQSIVTWATNATKERMQFLEKGSEEGENGRIDFMKKLVALNKAGKVESRNVSGSLTANIAAGSDTTGSTLGALTYLVATHPHVAEKLREEIRTLSAEGKVSNPVTFNEGTAMPYCQAIIKETLRFHPAVGPILSRVVPKGGATIDNHFFPEGTVVGSSAWLINYDKGIFGEDADQFRPERWLGNPENAKHMEANLFTFGGGSRTCIGKNISILEMTKLIPQIYRNFEFELVDPAAGRELEIGFLVRSNYLVRVKALEKRL